MKKLMTAYAFFALLLAATGLVFADVKVQVTKESELPFSLSPKNPVNSPDNSNNSINNSANSASNPNNSSANPENSPSKTENGMTGNRRLLFDKDEIHYFIGYFVLGENRLINFFSPYGKRMFYAPSGSDALYGSENGEFCGTLATANNKTVLMLTEKGQLAFKKEGILPFSLLDTNVRKSITGIYTDEGTEHHVEGNNSNGSMIVLDDGSMWDIDPADNIITALWKYNAIITVSSTNGGKYDYVLSNSEDGKDIHANFIGER
jgi:hypothetical protein